MKRRNWKSYQPATLRDALEGCKNFAKERHNLGVERIAERMGLEDHWSLYKWIASGRMPAVSIPAYQLACGCDFVTRWLAASGNKLLVDMPTGRKADSESLSHAHAGFAEAMRLISAFYEGKSEADATLAAITNHLQHMAALHGNVATHATPELDFSEERS